MRRLFSASIIILSHLLACSMTMASDKSADAIAQLKAIKANLFQIDATNCLTNANELTNLYRTLPIPQNIQELTELGMREIESELWSHQLQLKLMSDLLKKQTPETRSQEIVGCTAALFDVMQTVRVTANYFSNIRYRKLIIRNPELAQNFDKNAPFANLDLQLQVNPKFYFKNIQDLKTGDVVLTRADDEPMAYYALQGVHYQTLTHASLVYKPNPEKTYIVESRNSGLSYVELNSKSAYFKRKYVDMLILRHENSTLANRAAEILFSIAKNFSRTGRSGPETNFKNNLPYRAGTNFEVTDLYPNKEFLIEKNLKQYDNRSFNLGFSCIEAVRAAFRFASQELNIKTTPVPEDTDFSRADYIAFQNPKDINGSPAIPINYIEIDQKFAIVAEWKDIAKLKASNDVDVAMEAGYNWLFKLNYELTSNSPLQNLLVSHLFHKSTAYLFCDRIGFACEKWKSDLFSIRFYPDNIVYTVLNSHIILNPILDSVNSIQLHREKLSLRPMTAQELRTKIEELRIADLEKWRKCGSTQLHEYMYPREHRDCDTNSKNENWNYY